MASNKNSGGNQGTQPQVGIPYLRPMDERLKLSKTEAMERYGVEARPIIADEAWVAPISNFSKKDVKAEKWVLINHKNNTVTFMNTFDGLVGSNVKQDVATFPINMKRLKTQISAHTKVDLDQCPICVSQEVGAAFAGELSESQRSGTTQGAGTPA